MITRDEWMSSFYGTNWYKVEEDITSMPDINTCLLEWRISARDHQKIAKAQEHGFELVETFVEFKSTVEPDYHAYEDVFFAKSDDLNDIIAITDSCYCENQKFYTRLKNTKYFTERQCYLYYQLSVKNNFNTVDTISVVLRDSLGIAGYYMLKKLSYGTYKGLMTGVLPRAKGKGAHIRMQRYIFNEIGRKIDVINTTQLNNYSVVRNHIKEGRDLARVEHIFYKKV